MLGWYLEWQIGTNRGICIWQLEVKFLDLLKTNNCESVCQKGFHWSRTKVKGSKTIRYRRSLNHKLCRPGIGRRSMYDSPSTLREIISLWVPGGVWSQGWNLKELTERHTRSGACGLIWLNTGKLTRSRHNEDWQIESSFLILWVVVHGRS